jgi:DNA-binding NtrC family response regulator
MKDTIPANTRKLVWVVDDDETALLLAEDALASAGFDVRTFNDAAAALAAAGNALPSIPGIITSASTMSCRTSCWRT